MRNFQNSFASKKTKTLNNSLIAYSKLRKHFFYNKKQFQLKPKQLQKIYIYNWKTKTD